MHRVPLLGDRHLLEEATNDKAHPFFWVGLAVQADTAWEDAKRIGWKSEVSGLRAEV